MSGLLLHDLNGFYSGLLPDIPPGLETVEALPPVKKCVGCFGCWTRTPGVCVIADRAQGFAARLGACDELIVISRLFCGGPSPEIKAFLDRSIPYLLPYFEVVDGRMRHTRRYPDPLSLRYYYYLPFASEKGSIVLSGGDREMAGRKLESIARSYEDARTSDDVRALPSGRELDLMRRIAEANAKNLRTDQVSVEFVGDVLEVKGISL
jgi:multimeric flavodoxin WrbA